MFHLVIPAKNEAPYIQDTIHRIARVLSELDMDWRIIVVDNGSTDNTQEVVNEFRISNSEFRDKITTHKLPIAGKGAAIRHAADQIRTTNSELRTPPARLSFSEGGNSETLAKDFRPPTLRPPTYFGFIDADLSADPNLIPGMLTRLVEDKADIVIGSRLLVTKTTNRSFLRTLSSSIFNLAVRLVLGLKVKDSQCGLKLMNSRGLELLNTCQEDGWFLDIEFLAKARQDKLRVMEIPVPWTEFRYPNRKSHIHHFKDGLGAISAIIRIRRTLNLD